MSENLCTEFACVCNWSETYKYISVFIRTSKLILISNQNGIQVHVSRCKVFSQRAKQVNLQWEQWNCGCGSGKNDLHCLAAAPGACRYCWSLLCRALYRQAAEGLVPAATSETSASAQQHWSGSPVGACSLPQRALLCWVHSSTKWVGH